MGPEHFHRCQACGKETACSQECGGTVLYICENCCRDRRRRGK